MTFKRLATFRGGAAAISLLVAMLIAAGCGAAQLDTPETPTGAEPGSGLAVRTIVESAGGGFDGIAVAEDGTIYVSNYGPLNGDAGTEIFRVSPSGETSVLTDELYRPLGLAVTPDGNVVVSDLTTDGEGGQISSVGPDGRVTPIATSVYLPGLMFAEDGSIYAVGPSDGGGQIVRIELDGAQTVIAEAGDLATGPGIAMDSAGNIYTADYYNGVISKTTKEGDVSTVVELSEAIGPGPGGDKAAIGGLAIVDDMIFVTSIGTGVIYEVGLDGTYRIIAGDGTREVVDGPVESASFNLPNRLAFDSATRTLYISDYAGMIIRAIQL